MKVLVTGGAGYIGSHTVRQLVKTGADVTVLDNMVYGHAGALVDPEVKLVKGDLGDASVVYPLLMKGNFDAVIHFAAFINVGESVQNPLKYYMNNIARPLVLLGAMQAAGVKRFVFSSTCATYGVPTQIPIPETEKQDPINPYGSSKYMLEKVCRDCDRAWGLKSVFLRYFNASGCSEDGLIGEDHEPETHLIPNILLTLTGEKEYIEVFGTDYDTPDGTCIRDYIHVNDLADAHLKAVDYLMKGGATECFNLGTGLGLSVREILETAEKVTGKKIPVRYGPRREGDPPRLIANPKKAKEILGWEARCKDAGAIVETAWKWMTGRAAATINASARKRPPSFPPCHALHGRACFFKFLRTLLSRNRSFFLCRPQLKTFKGKRFPACCFSFPASKSLFHSPPANQEHSPCPGRCPAPEMSGLPSDI